jgi:hypothetical protein
VEDAARKRRSRLSWHGPKLRAALAIR